MIKNPIKLHLAYAIAQVETIAGKLCSTGERESKNEDGKGERQGVADKGFWHWSKPDCCSSLSELRDR